LTWYYQNIVYNHMFKFYSTYIKWMYMVITCKYGDVAIIYQSIQLNYTTGIWSPTVSLFLVRN